MANALTAFAMKNFRNGSTYTGWSAISSSSKNFGCGYYNSGENWTVAVRVTVNDYIDRISCRFCMTIDDMDWGSENVTWNYKIFTSESALNAAANYSTGNKGDGTVTWDKGSGKTTTFNIWTALAPGTYYVLFWRTTTKGCEIRWCNYSGNQTYYSHMTATSAERYAVSYNANGGSGAPSSQEKIKGFALTLSSTRPTRAADKSTFTITGNGNGGITKTVTATKTISYTFAGWATSSGGSVAYQPGGSYTGNAALTLYAVWTSSVSYSNNTIAALGTTTRGDASAGKYTVTFDANGGSCGTKAAEAARTTAYTFLGWGSSSSAGSSLPGSTAYTSATTVYARWSSTTTTAQVALPTPERAGYDFLGWAEKADAESGVTGQYTPSKNVTLYAIWEANGLLHIFVASQWAGGIVWVYAGGEWRRGIPWIYDGSRWKIGG